jgi:hypothetical protein
MSVGLSAPRFSGLVVPSGVAPTGWGRVSTDAVAGYFGRCAATLLSARPPLTASRSSSFRSRGDFIVRSPLATFIARQVPDEAGE